MINTMTTAREYWRRSSDVPAAAGTRTQGVFEQTLLVLVRGWQRRLDHLALHPPHHRRGRFGGVIRGKPEHNGEIRTTSGVYPTSRR